MNLDHILVIESRNVDIHVADPFLLTPFVMLLLT